MELCWINSGTNLIWFLDKFSFDRFDSTIHWGISSIWFPSQSTSFNFFSSLKNSGSYLILLSLMFKLSKLSRLFISSGNIYIWFFYRIKIFSFRSWPISWGIFVILQSPALIFVIFDNWPIVPGIDSIGWQDKSIL